MAGSMIDAIAWANGRHTAEEVDAAMPGTRHSSQRELTASNSGAGRTLQLGESHALLLRARKKDTFRLLTQLSGLTAKPVRDYQKAM